MGSANVTELQSGVIGAGTAKRVVGDRLHKLSAVRVLMAFLITLGLLAFVIVCLVILNALFD